MSAVGTKRSVDAAPQRVMDDVISNKPAAVQIGAKSGWA
jgi:hypothetical protein